MSPAAEQALTAYELAVRAEEERKAAEEAAERAENERRNAERLKDFEAALPVLAEWFPGVEWTWAMMGDYGNDTVLWDVSEGWPPSFMLRVQRFLIDMNEPEAGYRVKITVGDYVRDTSMEGYKYFQGAEVKSAADVGRYLATTGRHPAEPVCQCWNEGQYGRVHREDCPIHRDAGN